MLEIAFFGTAFVSSVVGIAAFRRYGASIGTFDIPNERSSHTTPTLRGGGLVIVAVCLLLYMSASAAGVGRVNWSFVAGAIIVAAISWIDDVFSVPASIRFIAHSAAAAIVVAFSGPIAGLHIPGFGAVIMGGSVAHAITFLWIVWLINAYNFMDGIDGIAGAQAVVAGIGWAAMGIWSGDTSTYIFAGVILFSCLGFLLHNWSPARVFMGDVGSAFLGFTFAAMPLIAQGADPERSSWLFTAAISFVWLFLFDSVFTFTRRLLRKEKVWMAHRRHLYQRLADSREAHATVSLIYAGLTLSVIAAFVGTYIIGGNMAALLFFTYLAAPIVVVFLASRKKI